VLPYSCFSLCSLFSFLSPLPRRPPRPPLFPYTTLFRSLSHRQVGSPDQSQSAGRLRPRSNAPPRLCSRRRVRGCRAHNRGGALRSEEHTSELQSRGHLVCRLLLEKKKKKKKTRRKTIKD